MTNRIFTQCFVVVGAIIEKDGKILLVQEKIKAFDNGKWNQPAGWLDVGENPNEAVAREVKEETGFDFEPTGIIGVYSCYRDLRKTPAERQLHALKIIYRGKITGDINYDNNEISDAKWFTKEEIELLGSQLRDADITREVQDYFAGKKYPLELINHLKVDY